MSNDTNSTSLPDLDTAAIEIFRAIIYRGLATVYLTIGLLGNIILLAAFYKQSRKEKAYGYQVVFTISKTIEIYFFGTFLIALIWLGVPDGWPAFASNYSAMVFFIYVGLTGHTTFINSSLLLAVAMAADRVLAVTKPVLYRTINHYRHLMVASICCFAIGFLGNAVYLFHFGIEPEGDHYKLQDYTNLSHSLTGTVFFQIRLLTRTLGLSALIILNIVMVMIFRQKKRKVEPISNSADRKTKSMERTLLWVNIYQACTIAINQLPHVVWVAMSYIRSDFEHSTYGNLVGPACDAMVMITDTLDFFVVISINGRIRRLVWNAMPKLCRPANMLPTVVDLTSIGPPRTAGTAWNQE